MTESNKTLAEKHNTFGGLIIPSDFDNQKSEFNIANRIISDWRFDERCRKNLEMRTRLQLNKAMEDRNEKNTAYTCKGTNERTY